MRCRVAPCRCGMLPIHVTNIIIICNIVSILTIYFAKNFTALSFTALFDSGCLIWWGLDGWWLEWDGREQKVGWLGCEGEQVAIGDGVLWATSMQSEAKPKRSLEPAQAKAVSLGEGRSWQKSAHRLGRYRINGCNFNIFNVCNRLFVNFCYLPPKKLMDIRSFSVTLQTLLKK